MKKVLQKSLFRLRALLLMAVMFAVGSFAIAQNIKVKFEASELIGQSLVTKNGVSISFSSAPGTYYAYAEPAKNSTWTVTTTDYFIVSIHANGYAGYVKFTGNGEAATGANSDYTWTATSDLKTVECVCTPNEMDITYLEIELKEDPSMAKNYVDFTYSSQNAGAKGYYTLSSDVITFESPVTVNRKPELNGVEVTSAVLDGNNLNITFPEVDLPGDYTLVFPKGSLQIGDDYNKAFSVTYTLAPDPNKLYGMFNFQGVIPYTNNGESKTLGGGAGLNTGDVFTANGVLLTFTNANGTFAWHNNTDRIYLGQGTTFNISAPAGYEITKIVFKTDANEIQLSCNTGSYDYGDWKTTTWTGKAESLDFRSSYDSKIQTIDVTCVMLQVDPTDYSLEFVDAPAGAAVTIDGTEYTANAQWTVAKKLSVNSITSVVEPEGYYAEKAYDEENKKFTITYKHWYTYNVVVTGHSMGMLQYDNNYYDNENSEFKSKTVVDENEFSAYPLTRYNAAINVESTGDYTYTVTVKYTAYPTLSINASAQDGDGNYWTTFSFNKPVTFPNGITPCIVTGEEDGVLNIVELEGQEPVQGSVMLTRNDITNGGYQLGADTEKAYITSDVSLGVYSDFWIYASAPEVNLTFHAPEGGIITEISFGKDDSDIQWQNGEVNGTVNPNAATYTARLYRSNGSWSQYVNDFTISYEVGSPVIIPANTGILLKSEAAASNMQYEVKEAGNADVTENLLVAAGAPDYNWNDASKTYYKFSLNGANEEGSVGFYWQVEGGHSLTPTANKAYLVLGGSANVRGFRLDGKADATEGIFNALNGEEETGAMFNLNGQRVNGKPAAGVYVKNGRKFIVK